MVKNKIPNIAVDFVTGIRKHRVRDELGISIKDIHVFQKQHAHWLRQENIVNVSLGKKIIGGESTNTTSLIFHVSQKLPSEQVEHLIPQTLSIPNINNIETDVQKIHIREDISTVYAGQSCSKLNDNFSSGAIGMVFQHHNQICCVTAGHVFTANANLLHENSVQSPDAAAGLGTNIIGNINQIEFNYPQYRYIDLDFAIIHSNSTIHIEPTHFVLGAVNGFRSRSSLRVREEVRVYSVMKNNVATCRIDKKHDSVTLREFGYQLTDVITLDQNQNRSIIRGDSGAGVYDMQGYIIGIVIAVKQTQCFVHPIENIFNYIK